MTLTEKLKKIQGVLAKMVFEDDLSQTDPDPSDDFTLSDNRKISFIPDLSVGARAEIDGAPAEDGTYDIGEKMVTTAEGAVTEIAEKETEEVAAQEDVALLRSQLKKQNENLKLMKEQIASMAEMLVEFSKREKQAAPPQKSAFNTADDKIERLIAGFKNLKN